MTIPYIASNRSMIEYIKSHLHLSHEEKINNETCYWYANNENLSRPLINNLDINQLVKDIRFIIANDFTKISRLAKFIKNIATVVTALGLPIVWSLPHGLTVNQSYLETKSTSIAPFAYSKIKINLKITIKNKYDKIKQARALMPNLIHSLDGSSLALLYNKFSNIYNMPQFFSVHDCFGTTLDKVDSLKTLLVSVYTELYSDNHYLDRFDKCILNLIENETDIPIDKENRTIVFNNKTIKLHDIAWVKNDISIGTKILKEIDDQYIII